MPSEKVQCRERKSAPRCVNTRGHGTKGLASMPLDPTQDHEPLMCPQCGGRKSRRARVCASCVRPPLSDRIAAKVEMSAAGCWLWSGAKNSQGYGTVYRDGRTVAAHRASYELHVGPIPAGLDLDHLCRTRACVNPEHLEPVTRWENVRRGKTGVLKEECAQGHPWVEENIFRYGPKRYARCLTCHLERNRAWRKRSSEGRGVDADRS